MIAAAAASALRTVAIQGGRARSNFPARTIARFPTPLNAAINSIHSYAPYVPVTSAFC